MNSILSKGRLPIGGGSILALAFLAGWMSIGAIAQKGEKPKRTEIFHVGRVGARGAAESRETLLNLYEDISQEYNAKVKAEQASNPQLYKGDRVRILRELDGGQLFMVAYNGGPSVLEISGDVSAFEPGSLSPALSIGDEAGKHSVEITRIITVKDPKQTEPALETVDEEGGGEVTFFGIAIPGTKKSGGSSSRSSSGGGGSRKQEVTETKELPKYAAAVSTERLDGGPQQMSTQLLVNQLKNGEVYTVAREELRRCQACRGFGRVATTKPPGFRDPDGKMECPECAAKGKISWDVTYKVTW